jgi:hypothetical protein
VPPDAHKDAVQTKGRTDPFIGASLVVVYTSLKMHCFCHFLDCIDYVSHIFLLVALIIISAQIYLTLNHFKIVFKFRSGLLFMFGIPLAPELRLSYFLLR